MDTGLVEFYESAVRYEAVSDLTAYIEAFVSRYFQCRMVKCELASSDPNCSEFKDSERLAMISFDGTLVGHLVADRPIALSFLKMAAWSIRRQQVLELERQQTKMIESLQLAQTLVNEGLPSGPVRQHGWEVFGHLRPAAHIGGDLFSVVRVGDQIHFLLLDAVGHGIYSALLAAQCKALWRGVTAERELLKSVKLLNRLIFEDSGSERFVAATLGVCFPSGEIEYVTCGQSPLFKFGSQGVSLLEDCCPPLGLFEETEFQVNRLSLQDGEGLLCVTDGVLEWGSVSTGDFSEAGVISMLNEEGATHCCESKIGRLLQALDKFDDPSGQRDDVCCVVMVRGPARD